MKAAQYRSYGGPEVTEINKNAPKPQAKNGQILVEVHAASLNPFDWKLRAGYMKGWADLDFPVTLCGDFSGVVDEVGPPAGGEVSQFKKGDQVYGQALVLNGGSGSLAEFASANVASVWFKPKSIDHIKSASLPLVGTSAIQALEDHIKLRKKQKVLILGGSGGIGSTAIQLAKHLGAYVATTASLENLEFAKDLGADEAIDYNAQKFEEILKDYDAVFDTVGGELTEKSFNVLKRGGVLVSMTGQPDPELAKKYGVISIGQNSRVTSERLKNLADLVDEGVIKAQVDKIFPLAKAKDAFEYLEKSHPQGKVVVAIK